MPNDEQIKREIIEQLTWDSRVDASDVIVDVQGGAVTLSGFVPTYAARQAALADAWAVPNVVVVNNKINVRYDTVMVPAEDEIEDGIKRMFEFDSELESSKIKVSGEGGWITLQGTVDKLWKKGRAEDLAMSITGVTGVDNKLAVVPEGNAADEAIAQDVVRAMERSRDIDPETIDIKVEKGKVTLSGQVKDVESYAAAYNSALYTAGVTDIDNNLVISQ